MGCSGFLEPCCAVHTSFQSSELQRRVSMKGLYFRTMIVRYHECAKISMIPPPNVRFNHLICNKGEVVHRIIFINDYQCSNHSYQHSHNTWQALFQIDGTFFQSSIRNPKTILRLPRPSQVDINSCLLTSVGRSLEANMGKDQATNQSPADNSCLNMCLSEVSTK